MLRPLSLASLALVASACTCDPPAREADTGAVPMAMPEPPPPPVDPRTEVLRDWLRASAVSHAHSGRSVLHAWITEARLQALRDDAPLLPTPTAEEGSALDRAVDGDTSRFAELLRTQESLRGRLDAWPTPWASRLGGEGDRLVRVELESRALIGTYDASTRAVGFFTDHGNAVPFEEALLVPQYWSAIYLVVPGDADHPPSRSIVLINESMIARVSYGTPELAAQLAVERERLNLLATRMGEDTGPFSNVLTAWDDIPPDETTTRRLYDSTLAVASDAYVPTEAHIRAVVAALGAQPGPVFERGAAPQEAPPVRGPHHP